MSVPQGGTAVVRELLRRNICELWGQGREELLPELYAEDVVDHDPVQGQPPGLAGMLQVLREFHVAFPDLVMELHGAVVDGDHGTDWWTASGTHLGPLGPLPPTGRRVRFSGSDTVRVRDGRIVEIWHVEDLLALATQLVDGPPQAAVLALAGR